MRIRRLTDGEYFDGPDGTPIPDGFEAVPERTPPTDSSIPFDNQNLGAGEMYSAVGGMPGGGPEEMRQLKQLLAQVARYGPAVLSPTRGAMKIVAGAGLSGLGSLAGDAIEGLAPSLSGALGAGGGHLVGAGVGKGLGAGVDTGTHVLSKLRLRGLGGPLEKYAQRDAAMVGQAVGEAVPPLRGAVTVEDLQHLVRGGQGKQALTNARGQTVDDLKAALTKNATDEGYSVYAGADAKKLESLLDELANAGAGAYDKSGAFRGGPGALGQVRDRKEILDEIQALLPEELWAKFQAAQQQYGAGKEILRWFKEPGRTGHALGPRGLNMSELQRVAGDKEGQMAARLAPEQLDALMRALFRGGRPPVTDNQLKIPLSVHGGFRIPLPLDYLAGPGVRVNLKPYGQRAGAGLGVGLGSTLGR